MEEPTEWEVRINSWNIDLIKNSFIQNERYIMCKELGKKNKNEHVHIILFSNTNYATLKKRLQRNFPGKNVFSFPEKNKVRDLFKFLKYIHKDYCEENDNIFSNMLISHEKQYWKNLWEKDAKQAKCRNKDTENIINEILEEFKDKDLDIFGDDNKIIFKIFIKHNGLIPHKTYWNQTMRTVAFHRGALDHTHLITNHLQEGSWNKTCYTIEKPKEETVENEDVPYTVPFEYDT